MSINGLYGNGPILVPSRNFMDSVRNYATDRQKELIESSVFSINSKLNIIRHNAGLICDFRAEDFEKHKEGKFRPEELPRTISYLRRCEFRIGNFDDYLLFLMFFLESITTASFSLLDGCGSLLNEMYGLQIDEDKINYDEVYMELQTRFGSNNPLVMFLEKYSADNLARVTWIKPLRAIKGAMKNPRTTDVCTHDKKTNLRNTVSSHTLLLKSNFFENTKQDVVIQEFVEECFNGLEEMVTELYEQLRLNLEKEREIPLYGEIQERVNEDLALSDVLHERKHTIMESTFDQSASTSRIRSKDIFNREDLSKIHQLLIYGNITNNSAIESLLMGMNREYSASLPSDGDPKSRLSNILNQLNRTEQLVDGELPMETLLVNAVRSISPQIQATELKLYLNRLRDE